MRDTPLKLTEAFRTKTGAGYHRETCRFVSKSKSPCQDNPVDHKLKPCQVCKPHVADSKLPVKSIGKENLTTCQVCMKGQAHGLKTPEQAKADGYVVTKTGTKYHVKECKHAGGKGIHTKPEVKVEAPKPKQIKPIKSQPSQNLAPAL